MSLITEDKLIGMLMQLQPWGYTLISFGMVVSICIAVNQCYAKVDAMLASCGRMHRSLPPLITAAGWLAGWLLAAHAACCCMPPPACCCLLHACMQLHACSSMQLHLHLHLHLHLLHADCSMHHAPRSMQHAGCRLQAAGCRLQRAAGTTRTIATTTEIRRKK